MKTLFTAAVAALAGVTAMTPAGAGTFSVGNSFARDCWQAAEARDHDTNAIYHCNLALGRRKGWTRRTWPRLWSIAACCTCATATIPRPSATSTGPCAPTTTNPEAWLNMAISHLQKNENDTSVLPMDREGALRSTPRTRRWPITAAASSTSATATSARPITTTRRPTSSAPDWDEPTRDLERYKVVRK